MKFQCVLSQTRSGSWGSRKVHWGHNFWGRLFCHRDTKQSSFILFEIRKNKDRPTESTLVRGLMGRAMGIWYLLPLYTFRSLQHTLLIFCFLMFGTEVYQSPVSNRMLNFRKWGVEWANKAPKQSSPFRPSVKQMVTPVAIHFLPFPSCHCCIKSSWGNFTSGLVVCPELQQSYANVIC